MAASSKAAPFSVSGKSAIITGAGSGINLSFAKLLLSKNCNVLIADLALRPEAQQVIAQYSTTHDARRPRAIFLQTDVTSWPQLARMFDVAHAAFGDIDIVCPGAGIFEPWASNFWHPPGTPESRDDPAAGRYLTLDINLTHPIRTTQLAIAYFFDAQKGSKVSLERPKRVVHISSIAGQGGALNIPLYGVSKAGVNSVIRSLASLESRVGIRVNGVAPGIIETPLWREHPEKLAMLDEKVDVWVTPEDVAEAMLRCVESEDMPGGTILEVGHQYTRKVLAYNDPGPKGQGVTTTNGKVVVDEVFNWLGQNGWGTPKL